jgi:hypothetical protein
MHQPKKETDEKYGPYPSRSSGVFKAGRFKELNNDREKFRHLVYISCPAMRSNTNMVELPWQKLRRKKHSACPCAAFLALAG